MTRRKIITDKICRQKKIREEKNGEKTNDLKSKILTEEAWRPQRLMKVQITEGTLINQNTRLASQQSTLFSCNNPANPTWGNKPWFLGDYPVGREEWSLDNMVGLLLTEDLLMKPKLGRYFKEILEMTAVAALHQLLVRKHSNVVCWGFQRQKDIDKTEKKLTGYLPKLAEGWKTHFKTLPKIKTRPMVKETNHQRTPSIQTCRQMSFLIKGLLNTVNGIQRLIQKIYGSSFLSIFPAHCPVQ